MPEAKGISQVKPRLGQGRAGIKRKMLTFPVSQPSDKPKQPKLLPGRKPIIQITERPPLQQSQDIIQSKTRLKISTPESLGHHDKAIPVSNYTIPQAMSKHDSISRTMGRKCMQYIRRGIPDYADPI